MMVPVRGGNVAGSDVPVWLLDVDGVVNAVRAGWRAAPSVLQIWSAADSYDYRIRYERRLVDAIRRIHATGLAEVTWCTTWCSEAVLLEEAFGLPSLPRAFTDRVTGPDASQAKVAAARRVIAAGRRLVWTDDVEVDRYADEGDRWAADGRALLINPNPTRGLRHRDLSRIEKFIGRAEQPAHQGAGDEQSEDQQAH
jgi:hypothetical protein